jgi:3-methylfumaryl-CoA hydratase
MPPLWHWVAFPEFVPMAELGSDGHPALGRFLPPLPYARRMWAGGKLTWTGTLIVGEALRRRSEILAITEKEGSTGPMVFVRVGHDIEGAVGRIREEQDIVYLDIPDRFRPPKAIPAPRAADFDETVPMTEARLFRYSAATFNAHRIHYDLPYAREIEKYPALVVHGPMQATLLIEAACRHVGHAPRRFRFKGVHPMFHDQDLRLIGTRVPGEAAVELCTAAASGHQGMQARMEWDA